MNISSNAHGTGCFCLQLAPAFLNLMSPRRILGRLKRSPWIWPIAYFASFTIIGLVLQITTGLPLLQFLLFLGLFFILRIGVIAFYLPVMFLPFWLIPLAVWISYRVLSQRKTKTPKDQR